MAIITADFAKQNTHAVSEQYVLNNAARLIRVQENLLEAQKMLEYVFQLRDKAQPNVLTVETTS